MAIFKKPKWLKPEVDEPKYYVHIVIVVVSLLIVLKYVFGHDMLTFDWVWKIGFATIIGDIVAHTILKLD